MKVPISKSKNADIDNTPKIELLGDLIKSQGIIKKVGSKDIKKQFNKMLQKYQVTVVGIIIGWINNKSIKDDNILAKLVENISRSNM